MTNAKPAAAGASFILTMLCVWTIVGITMGRAQSMGLYQIPFLGDVKITSEVFSIAMGLSQLFMGIAAPFTGASIDKIGAGKVVIVCVLIACAGLGLMYAATSGPMLLASGVLMGIGASGLGVPSLVGTVSRAAPPEKRLSAIASIGMAAGIGSFIAVPLIHLLMEYVGWQNSLLWLVGITLMLILVALPISAPPPATTSTVREQTLKEALTEAFAHPSFWLLTLGFFVCGFHVAFIITHLPNFAKTQGLPNWVGPLAISLVGIANIIGTFIAGQSGRFIEKRRGLSLIYFARAIVFAGFLVLPPSPWIVIALCAILGLFWLSTVPLTSGLVATFFGTQWMSMLFGIVFLSHQIGSFLGVWIAGRLFDTYQSYEAMWWISIALGLLAALVNWPIAEKPVARITNAAKAGA
jgi:predicted MFS family arabinose efflux permease